MRLTQDIFEIACHKGCLELVKVCLECGANLHAYNNWGLRLSIKCNQYEIVKYLLEKGANPYDDDLDAFWCARHYKRTKIVSLLENYRR